MAKSKDLTIKDWEIGIGRSPYTGFGQMTNVDVFSQPGSVLISHKLETDGDSDNVIDDLVKWIVQDPDNGHVWAVDRNGKLYERDNGGNWSVVVGHGVTNANGEGLGIWNHYLFYARRTKIDVYALPSSPNGDAGTWYNDWAPLPPYATYSLESSFGYDLHPMLAAQDGHFYIGNGHFVDNIVTVAGVDFDPGTTTTWTYNDPQLALGRDYRVVCLEDFATLIAVGTIVGDNAELNIADTFFWDGASDSFIRNATIHFAENGVQMMKNANNTLFTIAGLGRPRFFQSATSQAQEVKRFNNIVVPINKKLKLFPGATDQQDGEVLVGIGHNLTNISPMGVYSYRDGAYVLRYIISTGNDGSGNKLLIGAVKSVSAERLLVAWQDDDAGNTFGIDRTSNNYYTNYEAYIESPYYIVGTEADPKTFEKVEIRMGKKLNSGDGVRIKARRGLSDAFTTIATFDFATFGAREVMELKVSNMGSFMSVQFRVELTTASGSLVSPELKEVVFT